MKGSQSFSIWSCRWRPGGVNPVGSGELRRGHRGASGKLGFPKLGDVDDVCSPSGVLGLPCTSS